MDLTARDAPPLPDLLDPAVTKSIPDVKKSIQSESLDLVTATDGSFRELKTAKDPCRLDVVVIGDPLVGKTSLIHSYINQVSVVCGNWHLLLPRVIDAKEKQVQFEGHKYTLVFHDTGYDREKRIAAYTDADIIVLCYSLIYPESLQNIATKWVSEVKQFAPGKPYMLVGCKSDMRSDLIKQSYTSLIVDVFDGVNMSVDIDSQSFLETSSNTLENIDCLSREIPASVERYRRLSRRNWVVAIQNAPPSSMLSSAYSYVTKPVYAVQSIMPVLKQSYVNVKECLSNPGSFIEKKKAIISYIPLLKNWLPIEAEPVDANDKASPDPTQKNDTTSLKRSLSETNDQTDEIRNILGRKRVEEEKDKKSDKP